MTLKELLEILPDFQFIEFDGRKGYVSELKNKFEGQYDAEINYISAINNSILIFTKEGKR